MNLIQWLADSIPSDEEIRAMEARKEESDD